MQIPFKIIKIKLSTDKKIQYRGKLGNGEHLSLEAYKYKENTLYVIIIKQHKEHINFYPGTHFHRHNFSRYEVMAYKRRWRRSTITCIVGGNCERILVQFVCKVAEFWFVNYFFICWKNICCFLLMYNWPLCSRILRGKCYQHDIGCHGNDSRSPLPHHHKNIRIKDYFDQNMPFLSQMSLSLCTRLILLQIKHRNFKF